MNTVPEDARFLIWAWDPCQEGGWSIEDTACTIEEAEERCRKVHERGVKRIEEARAFLKETGRDGDRDPQMLACYQKAMVTSNPLFTLEA